MRRSTLGIIGRLAAVVGTLIGIHLMTRVIWWLTPIFGSPTVKQLHPESSPIVDLDAWRLLEDQVREDPFKGRAFWNYGLTDSSFWDTLLHHFVGAIAFGALVLISCLLWQGIIRIIYVPAEEGPVCRDPKCSCVEHTDEHFNKKDQRWYKDDDGDDSGLAMAMVAGATAAAVTVAVISS